MLIIAASQNQAYQLKQANSWPEAQVIAWQDAMAQVCPGQAWLTSLEQNFVWRDCVNQLERTAVLNVEALARLAQEAWWLMQHWLIDEQAVKQSLAPNTQWFWQLIKAYKKFCQQHQRQDLLYGLRNAIAQVHCVDPWPGQNILLYGFISFTPLQQQVIALLKNYGHVVDSYQASAAPASSIALQTFQQAEDEIAAVVAEVCQQAQQYPKQKIALIVPELKLWRSRIESYLVQYAKDTTWKIAAPIALIDSGLVQTALLLLQMAQSEVIDVQSLARLLRSPYWGDRPDERIERAEFMIALRKLALAELHPDVLLAVAEPWPAIQQRLHHLCTFGYKKTQSLSAWIKDWRHLLEQCQFATAKLTKPEEYQVLQQWQKALTELTESFVWQKKIKKSQAGQYLKEMCQSQYWPQASGEPATIEVFNVADAINLRFDQIYWLDVVQGKIPSVMRINPLLDPRLQKQYQVWASDTVWQDQAAIHCYRLLQQQCQQLRLSYSREKDQQPQLPASFVKDLPHWQEVKQAVADNTTIAQPTTVPTILPWRKDTIPGGSAALKAQQLCPMQAFAKYRLQLALLPEPQLGLTAIERGLVMHKALHLVWQSLQSQENLLALTEHTLQSLLDKIIPLALKQVPWLRRKQLPNALMQLETRYLLSTLQHWLALEATRPPFRIYTLEQEQQVLFAQHKWRMRVDRIDELADGSLLLIDYKTGSVTANHWQPEQFLEPQLPLYAVTQTVNIDAIAFAEISAKKWQFSGIANKLIDVGELGVLKKILDWPELQNQWRDILRQLTHDFVHQQPVLNPIEGANTCQRCGLHSFCRVAAGVQKL